MNPIKFPINPYIGQIYYSPNNKKVFQFSEITKTDKITGIIEERGVWFDITNEDLTL
tara:strand:+ start:1706 stop:1876 length:171 start_codon:yes stop_codon:yes gene_type:complete